MFCKIIGALVAHKGQENSDHSGVRTLVNYGSQTFSKDVGNKVFSSCACRTAAKGFRLHHPSQLDGKQKMKSPFLTDHLHYKFYLRLTFKKIIITAVHFHSQMHFCLLLSFC